MSGKVRVWDAVEAVNTKGEYAIISGRINDLAWDGDSQRIIAVGDGRERFGHCITYDSGNSVGEVSGHSKVVNAVAIRQQRPLRAATVSDDATMCFLHGAPFKFANKAAGLHRGFVMGTAFSPDGSKLVTVGQDRRIQLYDGKTGEPTRQIGEGVHTGSIFAVSWASDSKRFVTASADQTVRVWDAESGENTATWRIGGDEVNVSYQQVGVVWPPGRSDGLIISLSLNGDLNYLVEGKDQPIRIVQGHNKSATCLTVASSTGGNTLFTGSFDGKICAWDVPSGTASAVDGQSHSNQVAQFASPPGGKTYSVGWDDTLRTIDESTTSFIGTPLSLGAQPKGISASTSTHLFLALSDSLSVYTLTSGTPSLLTSLPLSQPPSAIAAHDSLIALGSSLNNTLQIYTLSGSSLSLTTTLTNSTTPISSLSFSPSGTHLAAGNAGGKILVFSTSDWSVATDRWTAHTARVVALAWNAEGKHVVSGGLDTNLHVWSLEKPGARWKAANAHKEGIFGVGWVGDDRVVSVGGDAAVKVWKVVLNK